MVHSSIKTSKDMKRFIRKTLLFALLFTVAMAALAVADKRYFFADNYLNEFPVKKQLIRDTPSPKMVVIGGSNVAFGIDSKTLSDSLAIPVVNAGLHAGLGLKFIMDCNMPYLCKGDILVIMPEYGHLLGNTTGGSAATVGLIPYFATFQEMADLNREQLTELCKGLCRVTLKMLVEGVKNSIHPTNDGKFLYLKSGFDERGDEVSHRHLPSHKDMLHFKSTPSSNVFYGKYLPEFISDVKTLQGRGIHVILLPPAILQSSLSADRERIDQLVCRLSDAGIPYAAPLDMFAYPNEMLYDSEYHLNAEGVKLNTKNILSAVKQKISSVKRTKYVEK